MSLLTYCMASWVFDTSLIMSLSSAGFWNQEREVTQSVIVMPKILLLYVEKLALRFRSPFHVLYGKTQSNAGDSFFFLKKKQCRIRCLQQCRIQQCLWSSIVASWLGLGIYKGITNKRIIQHKIQGLGGRTGLATKSSERLCSSVSCSCSCHPLSTTTGLGTDPNLPRQPSPPQNPWALQSLAAHRTHRARMAPTEKAGQRNRSTILTHRSVTSMPRKKLRKQRISIRRESSLLSEAGPPFLGFIYLPSDRSASLLFSGVSCLSRAGWRTRALRFVSHTIGERGEGGFMQVRRNRSRGEETREAGGRRRLLL